MVEKDTKEFQGGEWRSRWKVGLQIHLFLIKNKVERGWLRVIVLCGCTRPLGVLGQGVAHIEARGLHSYELKIHDGMGWCQCNCLGNTRSSHHHNWVAMAKTLLENVKNKEPWPRTFKWIRIGISTIHTQKAKAASGRLGPRKVWLKKEKEEQNEWRIGATTRLSHVCLEWQDRRGVCNWRMMLGIFNDIQSYQEITTFPSRRKEYVHR